MLFLDWVKQKPYTIEGRWWVYIRGVRGSGWVGSPRTLVGWLQPSKNVALAQVWKDSRSNKRRGGFGFVKEKKDKRR